MSKSYRILCVHCGVECPTGHPLYDEDFSEQRYACKECFPETATAETCECKVCEHNRLLERVDELRQQWKEKNEK